MRIVLARGQKQHGLKPILHIAFTSETPVLLMGAGADAT